MQKLFKDVSLRQINQMQIFQFSGTRQHHIHSQPIIRIGHPRWLAQECNKSLPRSDTLQSEVRQNVSGSQWKLLARNFDVLLVSNLQRPGTFTGDSTEIKVTRRCITTWHFVVSVFGVINFNQNSQRYCKTWNPSSPAMPCSRGCSCTCRTMTQEHLRARTIRRIATKACKTPCNYAPNDDTGTPSSQNYKAISNQRLQNTM